MFKFIFNKPLLSLIAAVGQVRIVLGLLSVVTLLSSFSPLLNWLHFDAQLVAEGQGWRPLTAWISHLNVRHWLLNQWGIVLLAFLLPKRLHLAEWLAFVVMWLSCAVLLWHSSYSNYVGLSGVLYGWVVFAAWRTPFYSRWVVWFMVVALSIKVASENGLLPLPQSNWVASFIGGDVAYRSHLWGLLSGLGVIVIHRVWLLFPSARLPRD